MSKQHLKEFLGLGIAGNFAHHLEQAGEIVDFTMIDTKEENAPKGMFPFYIPNSNGFLSTYPLSSSHIQMPNFTPCNLQIEPEMAIICEIHYEKMKVASITPQFFTAYNDCSIRKEGAKKISEKKNWGENSKGISSQIIPIDSFHQGGILDSFHIASYLKRDGTLHKYGEDSPVVTYNYFYEKLLGWIVEQLNSQKDFGPLEDLENILQKASYPKGLIVSIGATSYTQFGETTFLQQGDEIFVCVYDSALYSPTQIEAHLATTPDNPLPKCSLLHQYVL